MLLRKRRIDICNCCNLNYAFSVEVSLQQLESIRGKFQFQGDLLIIFMAVFEMLLKAFLMSIERTESRASGTLAHRHDPAK